MAIDVGGSAVAAQTDGLHNLKDPLGRQEGGSHYSKLKIQPIEYIHANGLDFFQGNMLKYLTRHKDKNGAEDLRKVIHYAELALHLQYGEKQ